MSKLRLARDRQQFNKSDDEMIRTCVRGRPRSSAKTTRFFCLPLPSLLFRSAFKESVPEERHGLILDGIDLLVIVGAVVIVDAIKGLYSRGLYTGGLCPRINSDGIAIEHI